jgi:hypothetical protein
MPESEKELSYFVTNRADKALQLAKLQQQQAMQMLAERDFTMGNQDFAVVMATLMQVLATNYAALRPK